MSIGLRITQAIKIIGINRAELSRRSGVPEGQLSKIVNGHTKSPRGETLSKIAKALEVQEGWLITGEGEREISSKQEPTSLHPRAAALLDNWEHLSEEDKAALERMAFALAQSDKKINKAE